MSRKRKSKAWGEDGFEDWVCKRHLELFNKSKQIKCRIE